MRQSLDSRLRGNDPVNDLRNALQTSIKNANRHFMPTIRANKSAWDGAYNWNLAGEEWSHAWGGSDMEWYGTILPRIHAFLPAATILEIAPGFGRWTEYLKDYCTHLMLVDLSEKCIAACQKRFAPCDHLSYFVNDGQSLAMIPDDSLDFIFSFDSLVHAEDSVLAGYVAQFPKKLKQNGAAFIHHSNLGAYSNYLAMQRFMSRIPKLVGLLTRLGILDNVRSQWRDTTMTARKMQRYAEENDLQCISQELITWSSKHVLVDCLSTIVRTDSMWFRPNRVLKNRTFMKEARQLSNLAQLYDPHVKT